MDGIFGQILNLLFQLRDYQEFAVEAAIEKGGGIIVSPAGSGKTVMGLEIIARLGQPALWVTHTKELLYQTIDRAVEFLQVPKDEIGIMGDSKRIIGDRLTVGLVQTLVKGVPKKKRQEIVECLRRKEIQASVVILRSRFTTDLPFSGMGADQLKRQPTPDVDYRRL